MDSSSDEEIFHTVQRRGAKNVIGSDSDGDDEDSDFDVRPKRAVRPLECESDGEVADCVANGAAQGNEENKMEVDESAANDLSDNEQTEKCAICLNKFSDDIATPETCDHYFCLECLKQWAKKRNTCPIDRKKFYLMLVRHYKEQKIRKRIFVDNDECFTASDTSQEVFCEICGNCGNEETLYLCVDCSKGYHCGCVGPDLSSVPRISWRCPECTYYWEMNNRFLTEFHQLIASRFKNRSPFFSSIWDNSGESLVQNRHEHSETPGLQNVAEVLSAQSSDSDGDTRQMVLGRLYQARRQLTRQTNLARTIRNKLTREMRNIARRSLVTATATTIETETRNVGSSNSNSSFSDVSDEDDESVTHSTHYQESFSNQHHPLDSRSLQPNSSEARPENFDIVGSILESQNNLHSSNVILKPDGSLVPNAKKNIQTNSTVDNPFIPSCSRTITENHSPHCNPFSNSKETISLHSGETIVQQRPSNPAQKPTPDAGNFSQQVPAFACGSSTISSLGASSSFDMSSFHKPIPISGNSGCVSSEKGSTFVHNNFPESDNCASTSNAKDKSKCHTSEDEVDIYSDIESIGEEDTIMSDKAEAIKVNFKCDESQGTNPGEASGDSSDNDLVIDEDIRAEEEGGKERDNAHLASENSVNNYGDESQESNASSSEPNVHNTASNASPAERESSPIAQDDSCQLQDNESSQGENSPVIDGNAAESEVEEGYSDEEMQVSNEHSLDGSRKDYDPESDQNDGRVNSTTEMNSSEVEYQCDDSIGSENQELNIQEDQKSESPKQANEESCDSMYHNEENNSIQSFESSHPEQELSGLEELSRSNVDASEEYSENVNKDNVEVDYEYKQAHSDDNDSRANMSTFHTDSTQCMDEKQVEDDEPATEDFKVSKLNFKCMLNNDDDDEEEDDDDDDGDHVSSGGEDQLPEVGSGACDDSASEKKLDEAEVTLENKESIDLGIEDISEAGSEDLNNFGEETSSINETKMESTSVDAENEAEISSEREHSANYRKDIEDLSADIQCSQSSVLYDEQEEGEIIDEKPIHKKLRRIARMDRYPEESEDYGDHPSRVNISDLPRIPKIKRDRDKSDTSESTAEDDKRTSVLAKVDLGGTDISWKRLSKHTRERSYRDGKPKDERLLYRERELRKEKVSSEHSKNKNRDSEHRREDKRQDNEKNKSDHESRSRDRKNEKSKETEKSKNTDWNSSHDKYDKHKTYKDKYSKERDKHSKERKEKDRHEKIKYVKDADKYEREKYRDDREHRYDREEEKYERTVYEKGKMKDKEHKSKYKERKNETSKQSKTHSYDKHKHVHSLEKPLEREVRRIDDNIKIVVEKKEPKKSKRKDKKEPEKKYQELHLHDHRTKQESSPYSEVTSIESKEIFAKGDSIIINVNFNRISSPKEPTVHETSDLDQKNKVTIEESIEDEKMAVDEAKGNKLKRESSSTERQLSKKPMTPPEKNTHFLPVGECYWKETDETDCNNSPTSANMPEEQQEIEEEEGIPDGDTYSVGSYSSSPEIALSPEPQDTSDIQKEETEIASENINIFPKDSETVPKKRSPRSPSPPSPADNDSYDPCEPTKSPSPVPPLAPPLPLMNPKPPPSPELPPLPPEPEPIEVMREDPRTHKQVSSSIMTPGFETMHTSMASAPPPPIMQVQTSAVNSLSTPNMLLPPPNFLHSTSPANNLPVISSIIPPQNFNFHLANHPPMMFPPNHMQQVMRGNFVPHPPPVQSGGNIPSMPTHPGLIGAVPPPPPPPTSLPLIPPVRPPPLSLNMRPTLPPNSLLQNLTVPQPVSMPQMHLNPIQHMPSGLMSTANAANHLMMVPSHNQPTGLPQVVAQNQLGLRNMMMPPNQLHSNISMQNQHMAVSANSQELMSQVLATNQPVSVNSISAAQKSEKPTKVLSPPEKNEVIDMDVDSPYSPGDSPSMDSVCDYSPTCSPIEFSPKSKDVFDSLLPSDQRTTTANTTTTTDKKAEAPTINKAEKTKLKSEVKAISDVPAKKMKHDSKSRHSVRMHTDRSKHSSRKEQKQPEKKEPSRLDDTQLKILDELPSSAVEMQVKEKYLKKLNRQERVVEEVKLALKPYYKSRDVSKEEYKDILRKSVPKICHNKSGEINPVRVKYLVECYVKKVKHSRKKSEKRKSKLSL